MYPNLLDCGNQSRYTLDTMDTSETYYKMCLAAFPEDAERGVCLKTQEQLQEIYLSNMPYGTYNKLYTLVEDFQDHHARYGYPTYASSMEQLWLAFYMFERHQKVWSNGEEWVLKTT